MTRVLIIDDDATGLEVAAYNLKKTGLKVDTAPSAEAGLARFDPRVHGVVVTDLRLPGRDGMAVLEEVTAASKEISVIVITAFGDVETAVNAMKAGAYDFLAKPFGRAQLQATVRRAVERHRLITDNQRLLGQIKGIERPIVSDSPAFNAVLELADRVAKSAASVLITGESGTGKELVARRIHGRSPRHGGPFVAVNCAAIPSELLESEMFGHEAGAFTGARKKRLGRFRQADGGTLFFDEVSELPLSLQGKLLRVLQEGEVDPVGGERPVAVDVRLVAATHRDLSEEVAQGRFREDLFYRLDVVRLMLPPLRERTEDLEPLVQHFVGRFGRGRELVIPPRLLTRLKAWSWPGNVRELANACERLVALAPEESLRVDDLPPALGGGASPSQAVGDDWLEALPERLSLVDLERAVVSHTLVRCDWNMSQAARRLGVPRHILAYRVQKYGIKRPH